MADNSAARFTITHAGPLAEALELLGQVRFDAVLLSTSRGRTARVRTPSGAFRRRRRTRPWWRSPAWATRSGCARREGAQDHPTKGRPDGHLLARALRYATERGRPERRGCRSGRSPRTPATLAALS